MLAKNDLAGPGGFLRGFARVLDLGGTLSPVAHGWPGLQSDDAASLVADWEALAGDQRRAWDQLSAELRVRFHGQSP